IEEWNIRLKLYNNQKRDKKAVGDTTLFSIHQTVLASLYVDQLTVEFGGKEEGDDETAENLDAIAKTDYVDMEKDQIDYDWDWDTLFFGRGLLALHEWERDADNKIFLPVPEVLDPLSFLKDPRATSINGNRKGKGSARFFGREIKMTKQDVKDHPHIFNSDFRSIKIGGGTNSLLQKAQEARDTAQNRQNQKGKTELQLGVNAEYDITEWHTHYIVKGKVEKVKVWLANVRSKVIGLQVLKSKAKRVLWPVIDRPLYPTSHDWDGTSIPDLTEDKQRARAVAQNLGLDAMKADLYPSYVYDSNKITNRKNLKFAFNKFIPIDPSKGDGNATNAIAPLIKARPNMQLLDFIYTSLDISAQKATATPDIQQGMQSEKDRPLGETNLLAARVDTRYSLAAKVFGWSEKRFWQQWYRLYKDNFEENIDEKILRVKGAFGPKWRPLSRSNLIAKIDPDVVIESKVLSRAKALEERVTLTEFFGLALQEPTSNRRWGLRKLARLNGLEKDEIDRLFPPTIDERIAEDQNDLLNKNKTAPVLPEDDHNVHLEIHTKARDTNAANAHIETHKKALSVKKVNPEFFPEEEQATEFQAPAGSPQIAIPASGGTKSVAPRQSSGISK
ncbi:MAG: hypothetical protein HQ557_06895, partial [Bacteroidetes bacterium]|nr:hypothetical protein [Bacteroidota bacterium]